MSDRGMFVWHDLMTHDLAGSARFYGELFGWSLDAKEIEKGEYVHVRNGERHIGGMMKAMSPHAPTHWIGYVQSDDPKGVAHKARAAGSQVYVDGMEVEVGCFSIFADPQGASIAAFRYSKPPAEEAPKGSGPAPGTFTWDELHTKDPDKDRHFYTDLFGWTVASEEMPGFGTYHLFKADGVNAGGMMTLQHGDHPYWLPYVAVASADQSAARATSIGAKEMAPPMDVPGVGRMAIFFDPQGGGFAILEPKMG